MLVRNYVTHSMVDRFKSHALETSSGTSQWAGVVKKYIEWRRLIKNKSRHCGGCTFFSLCSIKHQMCTDEGTKQRINKMNLKIPRSRCQFGVRYHHCPVVLRV